MIRVVSIAFAALLTTSCAAEAEPKVEPALELTGRVVDAAGILSPEFEKQVTTRLARVEEDTLVQLVVATTPTLDGNNINEYSLDLANAWGLGDAKRNDGLLVLVAPKERRVRIEVGYGLEKAVTNDEAQTIIDKKILPHFRGGDFETGISKGVDELVQEVTPVEMKEAA